jgi:hypothetical protein
MYTSLLKVRAEARIFFLKSRSSFLFPFSVGLFSVLPFVRYPVLGRPVFCPRPDFPAPNPVYLRLYLFCFYAYKERQLHMADYFDLNAAKSSISALGERIKALRGFL